MFTTIYNRIHPDKAPALANLKFDPRVPRSPVPDQQHDSLEAAEGLKLFPLLEEASKDKSSAGI